MALIDIGLPHVIIQNSSMAGNVSIGERPYQFKMLQTGIVVGIVPGAGGYDTEIWWAPESSAGSLVPSSSVAVQMATLAAGTYTFKDLLPNTTARQFFQARHTRPEYTVGPFSTWVSARPIALLPQLDQLAAAPPAIETDGAGNVFVPGGVNLNVGTLQGSTTRLKTLRLGHTMWQPSVNSAAFAMDQSDLHPESIPGPTLFLSQAFIPRGVTAVQARATIALETTGATILGSSASVDLYNTSASGVATLVATMTATSSQVGLGFVTYNSSALSLVASSSSQFLFLARLSQNTTSGAPGNARTRLAWAELDYTMPNYESAL